MAKNGDAGVGEVAEAPGVGLDERDRAVHALGYGVGDAVALSKRTHVDLSTRATARPTRWT